MTDGVQISITGQEQVIYKLKSLDSKVKANLVTAMKRITLSLAAYVKDNKLSGQVLKVKTGTLRRSIQSRVTQDSNSVTGIVESRANSGEPLSYAHYHEYGFQGTQSIREHIRTRASGTVATVRAHSRRINYAGRPFLRPSLAENRAMIDVEIRSAIEKATQE